MNANIFFYTDDLHAHHSLDQHPNPNEFYMHTHENFEIYYFISGNAHYTIEGNKYSLQKGDVLITRNSEAHRLNINSDDVPYERISIHFNPHILDGWDVSPLLSPFTDRPLGRNNKFSASDFRDDSYALYINKAVQDDKNRNISFFSLLSNLFAFLVELNYASQNQSKHHTDEIPPSIALLMIEYINLHLFEDITIQSVASHFYISHVYANRLFKAATGTTIWNYIIKKRLLHAREAIKNGRSIQNVYAQCGYQDYASFYRAYRK